MVAGGASREGGVVCECCYLNREERRVEDVEDGVAQVLALERWPGV